MKFRFLSFGCLLLACLPAGAQHSYRQAAPPVYTLDTTDLDIWAAHPDMRFQMPFNHLYHSPQEADRKTYKTYGSLMQKPPDAASHEHYYALACALWSLNKTTEAKQLFLNILKSNAPYYATTYYHSSDVPGDTSTSTYGYGSFTSNYKNSAAIYLAKIAIEHRRWNEALAYLDAATKKYAVTYSCGTGHHIQQEEYDFLYACCYEGRKEYGKVLDLLLPECLNRDDRIVTRVIRAMYSRPQIAAHLAEAMASTNCRLDTVASHAYSTSYGADNKVLKTDTLAYFAGTATMELFGRTIDLPRPDLANGERITRDHFISAFKETSFYVNLARGM